MFKNTAIVFGLVMVTGSAFAAGSGMGGGMNSSGSGSLTAEFHKLDTNGDGVLSPSEAKANDKVSKLYGSMNTNASIKSDPRAKQGDASTGGITLNQFQAGMQAASGGTAGPAVSGGQSYTVMKDGSKRMMSNSAQQAGSTMDRTQQRMQSAGQSMNNTASQMKQSAHDRVSAGQNSMQNDASQMRSDAQTQTDRMRNDAASGMPSQHSGAMQNANTANTGGVRTNTSGQTQTQSQGANGDNKPY